MQQPIDLADLLLQTHRIDGLAVLIQLLFALLKEIRFDLFGTDKVADKIIRSAESIGQVFQTDLDGHQSADYSMNGGSQQFMQNQRHEVALLFRHRINDLLAEKLGQRIMKGLLLIVGMKRQGHGPPFRVLDIFGDLIAQRPLAEQREPVLQLAVIALQPGHLIAKGLQIAEEMLVDQRGQTKEFGQRILQRRGGEQYLAPAFQRPTDLLSHLVRGLKDVAQLVRLVDHHQVPGHGANLSALAAGEMDGGEQHLRLIKRIAETAQLRLAVRCRVEDHVGQVELFLQLQAPLLAQRGRTDDQQASLALCPELAQQKTRFDGFAQPHLIGQQHAFGKRRTQSKKSSVDLVRVQIHTGIKERR
ncbi:MAG: hypothetical protein BWY83_02619 [bacterium ADurb.Bin478]|nr:MAG: hypothetical protein BWY83_02619 [bacterium ADurb.Bin478]